jgi:hypothetical protein
MGILKVLCFFGFHVIWSWGRVVRDTHDNAGWQCAVCGQTCQWINVNNIREGAWIPASPAAYVRES